MRSKRGTYLIEAAVVFPIVIFTLLTLIMIVMYFYDCAASQSDMHRFLRKEAGDATGKTICYSFDVEDDFYVQHERRRITAYKDVSMLHRGLLYRKGFRTISGSIHITDGPKYVLRRQILSE